MCDVLCYLPIFVSVFSELKGGEHKERLYTFGKLNRCLMALLQDQSVKRVPRITLRRKRGMIRNASQTFIYFNAYLNTRFKVVSEQDNPTVLLPAASQNSVPFLEPLVYRDS